MTNILGFDPLTDYPTGYSYHIPNDCIEYYSKPSGVVRITRSLYVDNNEDKLKLAGLCRHFYERKEVPPFIIGSSNFKKNILEKYDNLIPKNFEQKKIKVLEYLILKKGKEYEMVDVSTKTDFPLVYGERDELFRVMQALEAEKLITTRGIGKDEFHTFCLVLPTKEGVALAEGVSEGKVNFSNIFSKEEKETIFSLIEDGRIKDTFEFIKMHAINRAKSEEVKVLRLLEARLSIIQDEKIKGTITYEEATVNTMRLFDGILTMIK